MQKRISTLVGVVIILVAVAVIGGGVLAYQYWWLPKGQEVSTIQYGTIEGSVEYPSDFIPEDLKVCALNSEKKEFCTSYILSGNDYVYKLNVPTGNYYVFSTTNYGGVAQKAYYSEFVTCGEKINCLSHRPLLVTVNAGQAIESIDPVDYYTPWDILSWRIYKNEEYGFEIKYPENILSVSIEDNGKKLIMSHSVGYKHPDPCDFKGEGIVLDKLTDFDVIFELFDNDLVEAVKKIQPYAFSDLIKNGTLEIEPGHIEEFNIGFLRGYRIKEGVEGCGRDIYYFPSNSKKTLIVINSWVAEFNSINADFQEYIRIPGVFSINGREDLFNQLLSNFRFTK